MVSLIDAKKVQEEAKKEIAEDQMKTAKKKLKSLYEEESKLELALKNKRKEIEDYLNNISELAVYADSGVDI